MTISSRWFYSPKKLETKATILIIPGLNLHPEKMDTLSLFFQGMNCDVLRMALSEDPNEWEREFTLNYNEANLQAQKKSIPLYFVGHSLGALLGLKFITLHPEHAFTKLALFAPATHTKMFTRLTSLLAIIFPNGALPSFNLKNYRWRNYTALSEYKKLREMQKEIQEFNFLIETLVFVDALDELVHFRRLAEFTYQNPLWKLIETTNKASPLPRKYHHLNIDDQSLGHSEWEKILHLLTIHFSL